MNETVKNIIVRTSCPQCGQDVMKVIRVRHGLGQPAQQAPIKERCHACILASKSKIEADYLRRIGHLAWRSAGGKPEDMPNGLRMPEDPRPRRPAPVVLPHPPKPSQKRQAMQTGLRGASTPPWKPPSKVIVPPSPPSPRPKVLFVSHDLSATGAPRFLVNLLPHLRGMKVELASLEGGPLASCFAERGIPLVKDWRPSDYHLIVGNTLAAWPALDRAREAGVPAIWILHEGGYWGLIEPAKYEDLAQWVRKIVMVHDDQRPAFPNGNLARVRIIPPAIPPYCPFSKAESRASTGIGEDRVLIVALGSDEPRKGLTDLKQACAGLDVELRCIHGDPDPRRWLASADIFVSCSRQECYPLSLQEAKQHGLPILATAIPVHQEMIEDGVSGYWYNPGDVGYRRELLERLAADPALRVTLGHQPLRVTDWQDSLRKWESLLIHEAGGHLYGWN